VTIVMVGELPSLEKEGWLRIKKMSRSNLSRLRRGGSLKPPIIGC